MSEDLEARLAAAREARAKHEAERNERLAEESALDQVEAEELKAETAEAVNEAEKKHGRLGKKIRLVETDIGPIIVKRPTEAAYKAFLDKGEGTTEDLDMLVRPCLVYPDGGKFDRIIREQAATLPRVADAVCVLAGYRKQDVAGK
jgi:hypothetical protein